jgi:hypothetical protein
VESFNGMLVDEFLTRAVFAPLLEAKVLIERRPRVCKTVRPQFAGVSPPCPGIAPPLSARFGYASAGGQGRSLGRAALVIETGSIHGSRSGGGTARGCMRFIDGRIDHYRADFAERFVGRCSRVMTKTARA